MRLTCLESSRAFHCYAAGNPQELQSRSNKTWSSGEEKMVMCRQVDISCQVLQTMASVQCKLHLGSNFARGFV